MTAALKFDSINSMDNSPSIEKAMIKNGRVISIMSDHILIEIAGKAHKAQKAFSCFIEPVPDDIVICSRDETQMLFILGVLKRQDNRAVTFSYPAETLMVSKDGRLDLRSKQSLSLASHDLSLFSQNVVHKSRQATVALDEITATGVTLQASYKTVKFIGEMLYTMAKQAIAMFQGYIRNTENTDQIKAGQINRRTDGMYSMDSKYTIMVSEKDTKIDGERIHMA